MRGMQSEREREICTQKIGWFEDVLSVFSAEVQVHGVYLPMCFVDWLSWRPFWDDLL